MRQAVPTTNASCHSAVEQSCAVGSGWQPATRRAWFLGPWGRDSTHAFSQREVNMHQRMPNQPWTHSADERLMGAVGAAFSFMTPTGPAACSRPIGILCAVPGIPVLTRHEHQQHAVQRWDPAPLVHGDRAKAWLLSARLREARPQ